jgi:hypothetical protein
MGGSQSRDALPHRFFRGYLRRSGGLERLLQGLTALSRCPLICKLGLQRLRGLKQIIG